MMPKRAKQRKPKGQLQQYLSLALVGIGVVSLGISEIFNI